MALKTSHTPDDAAREREVVAAEAARVAAAVPPLVVTVDRLGDGVEARRREHVASPTG